MRLRYGMRLGRGLWVSGGSGIFVAYGLAWLLAAAIATTFAIGILIICVIVLLAHMAIKKRALHKAHSDDVALARRIVAGRVGEITYLGADRTEPQALWGVYFIEPSCGRPYATCGEHPATLRKLWFENRCGKVHELLVLPDRPMANALLRLLQKGVCRVAPTATGIVDGFTAHGAPIVGSVQLR